MSRSFPVGLSLLMTSWWVGGSRTDGTGNASRCVLQLGAATRIPGMTPAAIVHLLNFVQQKNRNQTRFNHNSRPHKKPSGPEPREGGERAGAVS